MKVVTVHNARATILVQHGLDRMPQPVETAFQRFVRVHENERGKSVRDQTTPLGKAYSSFWKAMRDFECRGRGAYGSEGRRDIQTRIA